MSDSPPPPSSSPSSSSSSSSVPHQPAVRVRCDFDKIVLHQNFERRGWQKTASQREWNFFWATVTTVKQIFNPDIGYRLDDDQIINHFPNHYELTRKDLMVKNIKRYRKELEREGSTLVEKDANGQYIWMDIFPATYTLPSEYSIFLEEFKRHPNSMWIVKPNSSAQGKGIFLVNKLAALKKWAAQHIPSAGSTSSTRELFVVSRYVDNPLLIGGKKFDMRIYVLVTSYRPMKVYLYGEAFTRFCNQKYTNDLDDVDNQYVHLTNVAIQKHGDDYNEKHGNKWSIKSLRLYLEATKGHAATQAMFDAIHFIIIQSLKSVQHVMINDKHCFECYGYDILLDSNLKPYLLEVNASPSLSITTRPDRLLKMKLIHDILQVVIPPDFPDTRTSKGSTSWNTKPVVGNFELLYDEAAGIDLETHKKLHILGGASIAADSSTSISSSTSARPAVSAIASSRSKAASAISASTTTASSLSSSGKWR